MRVLLSISLSGVKRNFKKYVYPIVSILVSMAMLSFICHFLYELTAFTSTAHSFAPDTVVDFIEKRVIVALVIVMVFIILTAVVSIYVYSSTKREEKRQLLAVLTSIGATATQKRTVLLLEALILYSLPTLLGVLCGILPARYAAIKLIRGFSASSLQEVSIESVVGLTALVFMFGIVFICACSLVSLEKRRESVISGIRRFNRRESDSRHTYRKSTTFRKMPITKRLAKKGIDYYAHTYGRIIAVFVATALYPIIAFLFFHYVAAESVVVDNNPYDGFDTTAITISAIENVIVFFVIGFLILFSLGMVQLLTLVKAQNTLRHDSFRIYTSAGMTEAQFREILKYEYLSVIGRAVIALIFIIVILGACFTSAS